MYSVLAISVAIHCGTSGIIQLSAHRKANIMCCKVTLYINKINYRLLCTNIGNVIHNTHRIYIIKCDFKFQLTSRATINKTVWIAVMSGSNRWTWPLRPIKAQFTSTAMNPITSMMFCAERKNNNNFQFFVGLLHKIYYYKVWWEMTLYLPHPDVLDSLTKWPLVHIAHFECVTTYFNQIVEESAQGG